MPLDWAMTQMNLGNALQKLWQPGERHGAAGAGGHRLSHGAGGKDARSRAARQGHAHYSAARDEDAGRTRAALLELAVDRYYRAALDDRTHAACPFEWAATQLNLGGALWTLGERESGTARLKEAVAAYRAALEERTRERAPLQWAMTQMNLGNALGTLGELAGRTESGTARLKQAVAALSRGAGGKDARAGAAPMGDDAEQPRHCASILGERESGTARLKQAVTAYRAALEEWTRERVPPDWAMTQINLGNALGGWASGRAARRGWRRRWRHSTRA